MSALSSTGSRTLAVLTLRPFACLFSWAARMRSHVAYTSRRGQPAMANASIQWNVPDASAGVTCSPRPSRSPSRPAGRTRHRCRWPTPARRSSCWLSPVRHNSLHATRVAAASALPPARPAATGIRLAILIASPGASGAPGPTARASAPAARAARLPPSAGTLPAPSPVTIRLSRSAGATVTSSNRETAWIHRHQVVVAIGPDRAHGELQVQLRRRAHGHTGHGAHDAPMVAVDRR